MSAIAASVGHAKFQALVGARVATALDRIRLVGNLSGQSYRFERWEYDCICEALDEAMDKMKAGFEKRLNTAPRGGKKGRTPRQKTTFVLVPPPQETQAAA